MAALSPQAKQFNPSLIDGQAYVQVPGGPFVMGNSRVHKQYCHAQPHWTSVDSFRVAVTPITEGDVRSLVDANHRSDRPADHPATCFSWRQFYKLHEAKNARIENPRDHVGFGTAAEWEKAALGEPLKLRQWMEENGLKSSKDVFEFIRRQGIVLQNAVVGNKDGVVFGADILADPKAEPEAFKKLINSSAEVYVGCGYASLDGSLKGLWYNQSGTAAVSLNNRVNGHGVSDMTGNVWELTGDFYAQQAYGRPAREKNPAYPPNGDKDNRAVERRGASFFSNDVVDLLLGARRDQHPDSDVSGLIGSRWFAAAQHSQDEGK